MAELVLGLRFGADIGHYGLSPGRVVHNGFRGQRGEMRIRSSSPRSSSVNGGDAAGTAMMRPGNNLSGSNPLPTRAPQPAAVNRYDKVAGDSPGPGRVALWRLLTGMRS